MPCAPCAAASFAIWRRETTSRLLLASAARAASRLACCRHAADPAACPSPKDPIRISPPLRVIAVREAVARRGIDGLLAGDRARLPEAEWRRTAFTLWPWPVSERVIAEPDSPTLPDCGGAGRSR